jgi:hypothetical protein
VRASSRTSQIPQSGKGINSCAVASKTDHMMHHNRCREEGEGFDRRTVVVHVRAMIERTGFALGGSIEEGGAHLVVSTSEGQMATSLELWRFPIDRRCV